MPYSVEFDCVQKTGKAFVLTMHISSGDPGMQRVTADNAVFIQTEKYVKAGIAVQPYGVISYDGTARGSDSPDTLPLPKVLIDGVVYKPGGNQTIPLIGLTDGLYAPADIVVAGSLVIPLMKEIDEVSDGGTGDIH